MQAGVPSEEGGLGRRRHACGGFPEGTDWFSRHQTWRKDPHYLSRRWTTKDIQYVRWIDEWRASAVTEKLFIELHACTFCFSPEPSRKGMPQSHGGRNQSRGRTILNLVKIMSWNCCVEPCRYIFILSKNPPYYMIFNRGQSEWGSTVCPGWSTTAPSAAAAEGSDVLYAD